MTNVQKSGWIAVQSHIEIPYGNWHFSWFTCT